MKQKDISKLANDLFPYFNNSQMSFQIWMLIFHIVCVHLWLETTVFWVYPGCLVFIFLAFHSFRNQSRTGLVSIKALSTSSLILPSYTIFEKVFDLKNSQKLIKGSACTFSAWNLCSYCLPPTSGGQAGFIWEFGNKYRRFLCRYRISLPFITLQITFLCDLLWS